MNEAAHVEYGDPAVAFGGEILRSVVGSGVHGIAIEGTDDHDEMGVYIEPPEYLLGVERHRDDYIWRTQPEGVRSGPGDTDLVMYSLQKYLRLAIKGNLPGQVAHLCERAGVRPTSVQRLRLGRIGLAGLGVGQWRYLMPYERF